jgi:hypothetical protein
MSDNNKTRLIRNTKTNRLNAKDDTVKIVTPDLGADSELEFGLDKTSIIQPRTGDLGGSQFDSEQLNPAGISKDDGKTKVYRGNKKNTDSSIKPLKDNAENLQPVTGWLVIVEGPGEGTSLQFSFGGQSIGRSEDQDISLCYGDEKISRDTHAKIEFDPMTREFYLSKGNGYVYLNDGRVGEGSEKTLVSGDSIQLGDTVLRFIPFCGKDFTWQDD